MIRKRLTAWVKNARRIIREHRDARGDDRCWLDDRLVSSAVLAFFTPTLAKPSIEEGMRVCEAFYRYRRNDTSDPNPPDAILDRALWDSDLVQMSILRLVHEVLKIWQTVYNHAKVRDLERTVVDDRVLYAVLPEKIGADFRLPPREEFLGRAKEDAGCPSFWDSHAGCGKKCNLHQWGPC